jgi:hypothetical protein
MRIGKAKVQRQLNAIVGTPVGTAYFQTCFIYDKFLVCLGLM